MSHGGDLKGFAVMQRRALLQSVRSDEQLMSEMTSIISDERYSPETKLIAKVSYDNADNRRKSMMQIVRYIERAYNLKKAQVGNNKESK